jgi:hypothetical protein
MPYVPPQYYKQDGGTHFQQVSGSGHELMEFIGLILFPTQGIIFLGLLQTQ